MAERPVVAIAVLVLLAAPRLQAQGATPVLGCYRADRLLGVAGPARPGARQPLLAAPPAVEDSMMVYFRLEPEGRASRRMLAQHGAVWSGSRWTTSGDTLTVRLTPAMIAWRLELIGDHASGRYAGMATYLSDVVVRGSTPPRVPVRVWAVACPPERAG